ncbi:MAG: SAM-dependent methyltransferase [Aestuariivita sp.]|nr:SAM-dependent methyltransferase [Aestuariivita sp.]
MTSAGTEYVSGKSRLFSKSYFNRLFSSSKFQNWASDTPIIRAFARKEGEEIFDLVMGFVNSQVLWALIDLKVLESLINGPLTKFEIAAQVGLSSERTAVLLHGAVALGLLRQKSQTKFSLSRKGASLLGVPGLTEMIKHHSHFYKDMSDPVALLRDEVDTELSRFWPYVFGASKDAPKGVTEAYSNLMAASQQLVARDTLKMISLSKSKKLLDIGGGSGGFAIEVAQKYPNLLLSIFDLPQVEETALQRLNAEALDERIGFVSGSFRDDLLPVGFDAISLIRVLYDHSDNTIIALLKKVYDTLPIGGQLIISEPMTGGDRPNRSGDVYFAFYTMAMRTGKTRSPNQISQMCRRAGFSVVKIPRSPRPFITSSVLCIK